MRVADAVGESLVDLGVEHVFGVVGSGNFHVTNALVDAGARYVPARHECAAVCMADGYARVSGKMGVASVHQGPGLTNAATGLTEAAKSRTPLLLLAADTSSGAVGSNFRIDQSGLARSVGAVPERLHSPETALEDLERAHRRAVGERRSVALMLPLDVQSEEAPDGAAVPAGPDVSPPAPSGDAISRIVDLVRRADRPAIIGGRGAVLADARPPLVELGDRIGAVLATSANGHGLFAGHPYAIGISGGFATPTAAELLSEADLVLSFGASLNMWTTRHGTLLGSDTTVVQVDVDPSALGEERPIELGVVADAAEAARALAEELERLEVRSEGYRTDGVKARIASGSWRDDSFEDRSTGETIDPRTLSIALEDLLPTEKTVAVDSGHFMGWPAMYLSVPDPAGFVFNQSYQSIGLGLGAAIGAAVARPDRLTVAALGDGGALMALEEFETAARLDLPLLIVVYNDAAYGAEVHHFGPEGEPVDTVQFSDTDFAAIGRAAGTEGITVREPGDLAPVRDWLERRDGPLVVDAKVAPDVVAHWLEDAFRSH